MTAVLLDTRRPIVTLQGRGGIGKTSLALYLLHSLTEGKRFQALIWFSARDIDLLPEGPKLVKPNVLTQKEIAKQFATMLSPPELQDKNFKASEYLSEYLSSSSKIGSILFVFDNFETVNNPSELYVWLETYIRPPNKILITTRYREFKADYPIEISGMTDEESRELINKTSAQLGIQEIISEAYIAEVLRESDGHPYVIKVLLGEVAKANKLVKVEKLVASKDDILEALFERTYAGLSTAAKRVFLLLCNWKSVVPAVAIESVLYRNLEEKMDVEKACEELRKSSFIEFQRAADGMEFILVPLAAQLFGKKKLSVSPLKTEIQADSEILQYYGACQATDIKHGIKPRIESFFARATGAIGGSTDKFKSFLPMFEYICRRYPEAWLLLSSLYKKSFDNLNLESSKHSVRKYLESTDKSKRQLKAWEELAELCQITNDYIGEAHTQLELSELPGIAFNIISNSADRINYLFYTRKELSLREDQKAIMVSRIVKTMESRINEADATDCSRLAWLFMKTHDIQSAKRYTEMGLDKDPNNEHCQKLQTRLSNE